MGSSVLRSIGLAGILAVGLVSSAGAQEQSTTCRLFPLACPPGPVPQIPPPLLGTPEEQAEAAPPPVAKPMKHRGRVHKARTRKAAAKQAD